MTAIKYLDRPPSGWFALDVMRKEASTAPSRVSDWWEQKWEWVALMVDYDPDHYDPDDPNYIGPPANAHDGWVCITGTHRNRDAAWNALEDMRATRH